MCSKWHFMVQQQKGDIPSIGQELLVRLASRQPQTCSASRSLAALSACSSASRLSRSLPRMISS